MKVSKQQIENFFNSQSIAIAGVSRQKDKFSRQVFDELRKKNFNVLPINPNTATINDCECYPTVSDLPDGVDSLLIITPKHQTDQVLEEALKRGIKNIWVQQFSNTEHTLAIAQQYEQAIIHSKCIFMFAEPVKGLHKFHHSILKVFGRLPN
ncbi:CoA-binding protein [Carboxylicivirga taeanensis]|uniref:CoA-binding protein n=1 Tax=Carboxylicivirga taeanensis TaxID=1416875 RepID=UPI003F6E43AF